MKYRHLGNTGLLVSEICFGTMTFAGTGFWKPIGQQNQTDADILVGKCLDAGVNFFDTANIYSTGQSEEMLGKALGDRRKEVIVATKVRGRMGPGVNEVGLSRGHILDSVDQSLRRLGTDYIDLYQIHSWDPATPIEETLTALNDVVRQGKVRYIGCSNVAAWQLMKALSVSERRGLAKFETLQAYYSVAGRDLERELAPLLTDQKMGLLIWSPLAGGFLTGKFRKGQDGPNDARRSEFDFPPINLDRAYAVVEVLAGIAESKGGSIARTALAWLLAQPVTTSVIVGAKTAKQLEDNLKAVDVSFAADELAAIDTVSALPEEYPGWMLSRTFQDREPSSDK